MSSFFEDIFSKHQCAFRILVCLLTLLGKWKNAVNKGRMFGALLIDLSKAFDCLKREQFLRRQTHTVLLFLL